MRLLPVHSSFIRRPTRREWLLLLVALGVVALVVADRLSTQAAARRYHDRYDSARVVGKTKSELRSRLGDPFQESDNFWSYQEGMDPDATIEFNGDRAVRVERYKDLFYRR